MTSHTHSVTLELPYHVQKYTLHTLIGSGGYGRVYLASHEKYEDKFAVKVVPYDACAGGNDTKTNMIELMTLKQLDHSNIIRIYNSFIQDEYLFLVLEYCPKGTLETMIVKDQGLSENQFPSIVEQIVSAIAYCHQNGIAHRDIKPSNILIDSCGRVKVADFGFAFMKGSSTLENGIRGTYAYVSPEILRKESNYDPFMSDVWSLGVMLYYMATGRHLWPMGSLEQLTNAIMSGMFDPIRTKYDKINCIIRKMVVLTPKKRISMKKIAGMKLFEEKPSTKSLSALPALSPNQNYQINNRKKKPYFHLRPPSPSQRIQKGSTILLSLRNLPHNT